ncbi:MAG: hypothetical protein ACYS8Z_06570 [Planctomycetota bacterium]|jgi:hypothetical protein
MAVEPKSKLASSLPVYLILAIIGGALYVSRQPLETDRPSSPVNMRHSTHEEDTVDARLWQDPLRAVLDHEGTLHRGGEDGHAGSEGDRCGPMHDPKRLRKQIDRNTHILLVMVRSGFYVEDHERRLRNRYALLAALNAEGYTPKDPEHIGYFKLPWPEKLHLKNDDCLHGGSKTDDPKVAEIQDANHVAIRHADHITIEDAGQVIIKGADHVTIETANREEIEDPNQGEPDLLNVPYEWLEKERLYRVVKKGGNEGDKCRNDPDNVLVVWLPEDTFSDRPLFRLAKIIDALGVAGGDTADVNVIGPSYSDTLRDMLGDIYDINSSAEACSVCCERAKSSLENCTIFSPWATASPFLLVDADKALSVTTEGEVATNSRSAIFKKIPALFKSIDMRFVRMIGSDDLLAVEIINELRRRGVDVVPEPNDNTGDRVALISEWDRFYGKAFPLTFATMMESVQEMASSVRPLEPDWMEYASKLNTKKPDHGVYFPENLLVCSYIRGIDGLLPESEKEGKTNAEKGKESARLYVGSPELPTGRRQIDYIRRLAQKLRYKHKVKAIGIVGTDVYDKLLLFQALREELGDVILFTIDLDERLVHEKQFRWTHNVIVASNYGLETNEHYQRSVFEQKKGSLPPFRDNYQTAVFLACRAALATMTCPVAHFSETHPGTSTKVLSHPRLFEIGRGRAVDISVDDSDVHPSRRRVPALGRRLALAVGVPLAVMFLLILIAQITWRVRETLALPSQETGKSKQKNGEKYAFCIDVAATAVVLFVAIVIFEHFRVGGEPFSLFRGVSIWPGEALRLIAGILSWTFIIKSIRSLKQNADDLYEVFALKPAKRQKKTAKKRKEPAKMQDESACSHKEGLPQKSPAKKGNHATSLSKLKHCWYRLKHCWHRLKHRWYSMLQYWCAPISLLQWPTNERKDKVNAKKLWTKYVTLAGCKKRSFRIFKMVSMFAFLAAMLALVLGPPDSPYRGALAFWLDKTLLIFSVVSMLILIFFVVDETHLCVKFMCHLKDKVTEWSDFLRKPTDGILYLPHDKTLNTPDSDEDDAYDDAYAEWLDIKFIAARTEAVGKLIYYPFIILFIMILARNRYFDNWNFPPFLIAIFIMNFGFALICGCILRWEAEKSRDIALRRLQALLVRATAKGNKRCTKWLETIIDDIKSVRRGAYSPFSENPVLHAILIPSGGVSLLTLLRFCSLTL